VLEYTGGSLCPKLDDQGRVIDGEENTQGYRKSALLAMTCDRELLLPAAVSFVGVLNECSYFFEVRTASACPTVKQQALGPISIFGVMYVDDTRLSFLLIYAYVFPALSSLW